MCAVVSVVRITLQLMPEAPDERDPRHEHLFSSWDVAGATQAAASLFQRDRAQLSACVLCGAQVDLVDAARRRVGDVGHPAPVTQADAVRSWWRDLDDVDQRRALSLCADDELPEDLALGLAMAGVTVPALGASPVDGRPTGYICPTVLCDFLDERLGC